MDERREGICRPDGPPPAGRNGSRRPLRGSGGRSGVAALGLALWLAGCGSGPLPPPPAAGAARPAVGSPSPLAVGETFTIDSRILGETRRINVYLPPASAASPAARLPVLYMPDGGLAEDFLHVAGLVQVSAGNGTMRPFLLVGIENTERRRDLTGPTGNAEDRKIAPRVGGSEAFRRFLRRELMPQVEARYRTTDEAAIVGESLAGLFVVETLLLEPDLFDTYLAFDPSLWWNDGRLVEWAAERLRAWPEQEKTLYLATSGEPGIVEGVERLAAVLAGGAPPNLRWHHERMPEETHATIYHPAALRAFRAVLGLEPPTAAAGPADAGGQCSLQGVTLEPIAVAEAEPSEQHGRLELPDRPHLWQPAGPDPVRADFEAAVRARLGTVEPRWLIERQRAIFARLPGEQSGEAVNSARLLEGRAGRIGPISCLEAMLWTWQAARFPPLERPTEFGAFVLRGQGRVRVYLSGADRVGQRIRREVTDLVAADVAAGFEVLAHLHNHPFLFDRVVGDRMWTTEGTKDDVAGALAPSMTDVQFYRNLRASHGLREAWVTNGLDTARFRAAELDLLQAP